MTGVRPLLAGTPRTDGDALVIACARRDVRVSGDPAFAAALLGRCDGRTDAADIVAALAPEDRADAADLLRALLEQGALVDGTDAWRVLHEQSSLGSPLFPDPGPDALAAIAAERHVPGHLPGRGVALTPAPSAVAELAGRRASAVPGDGPRLPSFDELGTLLEVAYRRRRGAHATVASAGGLYPLVLHVLVRAPLGPLAPGVWWLDHECSRLELVRPGAPELHGVFLRNELSDALLAAGGPVLVLSADIARVSRKYGNRAYRFALIEVGSAWQNAALAAAELGVPARPLSAFSEDRMADAVDAGDVQPLLAVLLGA